MKTTILHHRFIAAATAFLAAAIATRAADTVALGFPLDYTTSSALFPGLGEDPEVDLVPRLGQTFVVPAGHPYLTTFSFWLGDSPVFQPQAATFNAVLMAFGSDRPSGEPLYQGPVTSTAGLQHGEVRRFDFNVGVSLNSLARYVVFLNAAPYLDGVPSFATFASTGTDVYPNGTLVSSRSTASLDQVSDSPWQIGASGWDVVFRAEFRSVPEPSSLPLLCVAGIPMLIGLWSYRKCCRLISKQIRWKPENHGRRNWPTARVCRRLVK